MNWYLVHDDYTDSTSTYEAEDEEEAVRRHIGNYDLQDTDNVDFYVYTLQFPSYMNYYSEDDGMGDISILER